MIVELGVMVRLFGLDCKFSDSGMFLFVAFTGSNVVFASAAVCANVVLTFPGSFGQDKRTSGYRNCVFGIGPRPAGSGYFAKRCD